MHTTRNRRFTALLALFAALIVWLCLGHARRTGGEASAVPIDAKFVFLEAEHETMRGDCTSAAARTCAR